MIFGPPAAPHVRNGEPSVDKTMVGLMLESGRLFGAIAFASEPTRPKAFGIPGEMLKSSIWLLSITPVPGTMTLHPQVVLTVEVSATQFPRASAVVRCVVCYAVAMSSSESIKVPSRSKITASKFIVFIPKNKPQGA